MNKQEKLCYNLFSGTYYNVLENDIKLLSKGQIPLIKRPTNCKKCYNRGYLGKNTTDFAFIPCNCLKKNIDFVSLKLIPDDTNEI
jgi:hypothetical protein